MTTVRLDTLSSKVYYYLDKLDREMAFQLKPSQLRIVPMFEDVDLSTLSQYLRRWKKKKPAPPKTKNVQNVQNSTDSIENSTMTLLEQDDDIDDSFKKLIKYKKYADITKTDITVNTILSLLDKTEQLKKTTEDFTDDKKFLEEISEIGRHFIMQLKEENDDGDFIESMLRD
jgi:hypothetical protein